MPPYGFLARAKLDGQHIQELIETQVIVGVPYSEEMVENAKADFLAQANPDADTAGLEARYGAAAFGKAVNIRNFDGQQALTEMDALIAYMQVLGTMVDFSTFTRDPNR